MIGHHIIRRFRNAIRYEHDADDDKRPASLALLTTVLSERPFPRSAVSSCRHAISCSIMSPKAQHTAKARRIALADTMISCRFQRITVANHYQQKFAARGRHMRISLLEYYATSSEYGYQVYYSCCQRAKEKKR